MATDLGFRYGTGSNGGDGVRSWLVGDLMDWTDWIGKQGKRSLSPGSDWRVKSKDSDKAFESMSCGGGLDGDPSRGLLRNGLGSARICLEVNRSRSMYVSIDSSNSARESQ